MTALGDEFVEFARSLPPFNLLDEEALRDLGSKVSQVTYARGTSILTQDGPASEHLMLVRRGGVRVVVRAADGDEMIVDHRQAGGIFGYLSLLSADRSRAEVITEDETTVYLIRREQVLDLMARNPAFSEYFLKSLLSKYIDRTFRELPSKGLTYGSGDQLLFTTPVQEVTTKDPPRAPASITAVDAARLMTSRNASSLVLTGPDDEPVGILTDKDLRQKVLAEGYSQDDPVDRIMTRRLITIDAGAACLEAMLKMLRHNIHHLIVTRDGRLDGVVTNHDIMILQGASPLSLARDIERQRTIEGIVPVARKVRGIVALLLKSGAPAGVITRIVTEINDRLVRRILILGEQRFGPPPLPYCWIAFGSEGRKEQTISTDQDNAIVFGDTGDRELAGKARDYFGGFASWANDTLAQCGFPPCSGNYMASNEHWRQPLAVMEEILLRVDIHAHAGGRPLLGDPVRLPPNPRPGLPGGGAACPPPPGSRAPPPLPEIPGPPDRQGSPAPRPLQTIRGRPRRRTQGADQPEIQSHRPAAQHRPPVQLGKGHHRDIDPAPHRAAAGKARHRGRIRRRTDLRVRVGQPDAHQAAAGFDPRRDRPRKLR